MIQLHRPSGRSSGAAALIVMLAIMASGCGGATAKPDSEAATRETAASPSVSAPAQVPKREPVWLDTLQMVSATTGWALLWPSNPNHNGALAVARTIDGGRTWTTVTPPAAVPALATGQALIEAATAERAWLAVTAGNSRTPKTHVFGTTDGGQSWRESAAVGGAASPVAIDFAGSRHGWLLDSLGAAMSQNPVTLYQTIDGGLVWSLVARSAPIAGGPLTSSGLPVGCDKDGIAFQSAMTGWITSSCPGGAGAVLASTDGGAHWAPAALPPAAQDCQRSGCDINPPQFAGQSAFLVIGVYPAHAYLLVSRDAGQDWQADQLPAGAGPYPRVRFFSASAGIAIPAWSQGRIGRTFFVTTSGGQRWTAVRQGRRFRGYSDNFDFVSLRSGFSWTYPGAGPAPALPRLLRTSDSGRIWASVVPRLLTAPRGSGRA